MYIESKRRNSLKFIKKFLEILKNFCYNINIKIRNKFKRKKENELWQK